MCVCVCVDDIRLSWQGRTCTCMSMYVHVLLRSVCKVCKVTVCIRVRTVYFPIQARYEVKNQKLISKGKTLSLYYCINC